MTAQPAEALLPQVRRYLTQRGAHLSKNSVDAYTADLRLVALALAAAITPNLPVEDIEAAHAATDDLTLADLTTDNLADAFALIAQGAFRRHGTGRRTTTSVRRAWTSMSSFCERLVDKELINRNPMRGVDHGAVPRSVPKALSAEQSALLLEAAGAAPGGQVRIRWPERDRAIILTALLTGVRASELTALSAGSIGGEPGLWFVHVVGKGSHERNVPLPAAAADALATYLDSRISAGPPRGGRASAYRVRMRRGTDPAAPPWMRILAEEPLFVTVDGASMTREHLYRVVDHIYRQAGMSIHTRGRGVAVHALRHTYATSLDRNGASIVELQTLLGHVSPATSARYVATNPDNLHHLAETLAAALTPSAGHPDSEGTSWQPAPPST